MKWIEYIVIALLLLCLPGFVSCFNYEAGEWTAIVEITLIVCWIFDR
jgi:hypothetical protein